MTKLRGLNQYLRLANSCESDSQVQVGMVNTLWTPAARLLARVMSDLSEEYFCAGWINGGEYTLWADLTGRDAFGRRAWGITEEEKAELRLAQETAEGWVIWSEDAGGLLFLSNQEWLGHLAGEGQEPEQKQIPPG